MNDIIPLIATLVIVFVAFAVGIGTLVLWVWMLIDCIRRDFKDKALWLILMVLGGVIGSIAYFFAVYRKFGPAK